MKASSTDSSSAERSQAEFEQRQKEQQRLIDEGKLTAEEATRRNFKLARHIHRKITVRQGSSHEKGRMDGR